MTSPELKYYHVNNSSRPIASNGLLFTFETYDNFAGTPRGIYATNDLAQLDALELLVGDPASAVRRLDKPTYEQKRQAKTLVGKATCTADVRGVGKWPSGFLNHSNTNQHTVVITNFQRPDFLKSAFASVATTGIKNIVVTSSGATSEIESIHEHLKKSGAIVVSEKGDSGCNANWLAGVKAARTNWITILHDDDLLLPDFSYVEKAIQPDIGFILWDARRHGMGYKDILPILDLPTGVYPTKKLFRNVMIENSFTLSPTIGCFRRDDLISTLTEAQEKFGPEFHIKPTMMVGNDLLIWLRAIEKHKYFKYIKAPLTSFGHHPGSTTCDEVFNRRGKLGNIYNLTRKHFLETYPKIVHVVSRYRPGGETQRRVEFAASSWKELYASGMVTPCHVWNAKRDSGVIGDHRNTHFLKDVLEAGIAASKPGDLVMLTNDDTVVHPDLPWYLFDVMLSDTAMCAFRQSFKRGQCPSLKTHRDFFKAEQHDWGRDLFVFRRDWLETHMKDIPDYVLGATDWDSTLATIIRLSKGIAVSRDTWVRRDPRSELPTGFVYHEVHSSVWGTPENRKNLPGNVHNRKLTLEFMAKNGVGWFV